MRQIPLDRFLRFTELEELLLGLAEDRPDLLSVTSIGKSHEGRDLWLCTLTDTSTGPAEEKPALWVDANIHATELTGSTAALCLIDRLLSGHGTDEAITDVLRTRAFYVVPRMGPDGAELAMAEKPRWVRSSVRTWPRTEQLDGLVQGDVDGDGRILTMRVPDPNGTWRPSAGDPRLLVARDPVEDGPGPYYRLLSEGEVQGYDGVTVKPAPPLSGLDMNRNYPVEWRTPNLQPGAGDYPTSEPEVRAVVQALVDRPNVCGYIQYHTFSGVHLRPYSDRPDDKMPTFDLRVFKEMAKKATEITGYPAVSVHHDFRYDPKDVLTGGSIDWAYDHMGVHAWVTEFWSARKAAGIEDESFIAWWLDHAEDDDLKLLAWADEHLPGRGFVDWYAFDHPQLGQVELGGFDTSIVFRNPPLDLLAAEVAPHADWAIWQLRISPLLRLRSLEATPAGEGAWKVRLVVENAGYLPTQVTEKAMERKVVRPLEARLLTEGPEAVLVSGERRQELGQLAGRALKRSMLGGFGSTSDGTGDRVKAEWVVEAPPGTTIEAEARHQRAGVVRASVVLGDG